MARGKSSLLLSLLFVFLPPSCRRSNPHWRRLLIKVFWCVSLRAAEIKETLYFLVTYTSICVLLLVVVSTAWGYAILLQQRTIIHNAAAEWDFRYRACVQDNIQAGWAFWNSNMLITADRIFCWRLTSSWTLFCSSVWRHLWLVCQNIRPLQSRQLALFTRQEFDSFYYCCCRLRFRLLAWTNREERVRMAS